MLIRKATIDDIDFIISSNMSVNEVSNLNKKSGLAQNFKRDILCDNPKAYCLIAEDKKEQIAYCLYSYVYWANEGQVVHVSNIFVKPKHRRKGLFKKLVDHIKNTEKVPCITMLVDNENEIMINTLNKYDAKSLDMKTYYLK